MIRPGLKRIASNPTLREARPLLVAMTIGLTLALMLTAAGAWRPDQTDQLENSDRVNSEANNSDSTD